MENITPGLKRKLLITKGWKEDDMVIWHKPSIWDTSIASEVETKGLGEGINWLI